MATKEVKFLGEGEIAQLKKLQRALEQLRRIDREEMSAIRAELLVCLALSPEDTPRQDCQHDLELTNSAIGRQCNMLSDVGDRGKPGYRLIQDAATRVHDGRKRYELTKTGVLLMKRLARIMTD